jgi:hypothetical protein
MGSTPTTLWWPKLPPLDGCLEALVAAAVVQDPKARPGFRELGDSLQTYRGDQASGMLNPLPAAGRRP